LRKNKARATFFVNGNCLESYPEVVAYAASCGCEIGNHTQQHPHLPELSYQEIVNQVERTSATIKLITNETPKILRPPYGECDDKVKQAVGDCGLALINWSIDPQDWDTDDGAITRQRVLDQLEDGAVVLCHDRMFSTCQLMTSFIEELIEKGYELVTISELFAAKKVNLIPGVLYNSPYEIAK
jgi:peptidoglycan/xylan/chitin deacetylase (PgdA/CDA1 family)